jgi:hypothetical protein
MVPVDSDLSPASKRTKSFLPFLYGAAVIGGSWNVVRGFPDPMNVLLPLIVVVMAVAAFALSYSLNVRNLAAVIGTVLFLFLAEVSGVNIGFPFGDYAYASSLGPKLLDVPLVVPLFWLTVLIASWSASDRLLKFKHVIVAAIIVTAFDGVLEFAADSLGLWHWRGGMPTEFSFLSRFGVAYLGISLLHRWATEKTPNPVVPHLLIIQLVYFALSDVGIRYISPLISR